MSDRYLTEREIVESDESRHAVSRSSLRHYRDEPCPVLVRNGKRETIRTTGEGTPVDPWRYLEADVARLAAAPLRLVGVVTIRGEEFVADDVAEARSGIRAHVWRKAADSEADDREAKVARRILTRPPRTSRAYFRGERGQLRETIVFAAREVETVRAARATALEANGDGKGPLLTIHEARKRYGAPAATTQRLGRLGRVEIGENLTATPQTVSFQPAYDREGLDREFGVEFADGPNTGEAAATLRVSRVRVNKLAATGKLRRERTWRSVLERRKNGTTKRCRKWVTVIDPDSITERLEPTPRPEPEPDPVRERAVKDAKTWAVLREVSELTGICIDDLRRAIRSKEYAGVKIRTRKTWAVVVGPKGCEQLRPNVGQIHREDIPKISVAKARRNPAAPSTDDEGNPWIAVGRPR